MHGESPESEVVAAPPPNPEPAQPSSSGSSESWQPSPGPSPFDQDAPLWVDEWQAPVYAWVLVPRRRLRALALLLSMLLVGSALLGLTGAAIVWGAVMLLQRLNAG